MFFLSTYRLMSESQKPIDPFTCEQLGTSQSTLVVGPHTGVEAGKFLGLRRIFARIFPNLPEKLLGHFLCEHFLSRLSFGMTPKKRSSYDSVNVGCYFFQIKLRWAPFLPRFSEILQRFSQILPGFSIETFGGGLAPPHPAQHPRILQHSDHTSTCCH